MALVANIFIFEPLLVLAPLLIALIPPGPRGLLEDCMRAGPRPKVDGLDFFLALGVLEFEADPPP
jgi:hypothetical protein